MPVQNLNFQGINRAVSDYGNAGACEELINLRPTTGGLVPVKQFVDKYNGTLISCGKIFVHKAGSANNYLTLTHSQGESHTHIYTISLLNNNGTQTSIDSVTFGTRYPSIDDVHFATTGNIMLFSFVNKTALSGSRNYAYIWDGTQYNKYTADVPSISVNPSATRSSATGDFNLPSSPNLNQLVDTINISLNALQENNPNLCFGPFILALAYKTKDGSTFWTWGWLIHDATAGARAVPGFYLDSASGASDYPNFFQKFSEGFLIAGNTDDSFILYGNSIDLDISLNSDFDFDTNIIQSIEVYASKPVPYIDTDAMLKSGLDVTDFGGISGGAYHRIAPVTQYKDMALDKQLLYHQKTITIKELEGHDSEDPLTISLSFGGNIQLTGKTLEVDAGAVTRYGNLLSYNARFHYYDSYSRTEIAMPDFTGLYGNVLNLVDHHVFVVYNNGKKDQLLYLGTKKLFDDDYPIVITSSLNIREVHTYYRQDPADDWTVRIYLLDKSQTYNYSISAGGPASNDTDADTEHTSLIGRTPTSSVITEEPDAINVTEQYNPFVFRVEHSYLAPGKVLDIQPQMVAVADVSYGDYPLNVFTNRGLYALLQGSGTVLYGAFRPVSNLITTANSVPTESGTFFLASGSLWVISGSKAVLISDALSLGPHKYIRNCAGYQAISNGEYNVQDYESKVTFEDYVNGGIHNNIDCGNGATLSYNRYRDELFISNTAFDYSYVLSLKYRQWFKMDLKVVQDVVGDAILKKPVGTDLWRVLDLSDESEDTSVLVHLQTRPFSMGYQYIHVHRLISMVRAALSTDDLLIVGLYGSDNLQDWKLLSYASRAGIKISQIRTPSAARSWRYYTICIGGTCPSDTDFGTTLFDYEPVIRRIG